MGARGPVLQDPAPRALPRDREPRRDPPGRAAAPDRGGHRSTLRTKLKELGIKADVEGRPKHLYSIYEKMVIRGKEFNEIYDLVGVRILVESLRDTYARPRRRPRPVEADPRALQGLRRDAQVEHVPVAAHDGRWVPRASRSRSRSARATCIARRSSASPRTGATRRGSRRGRSGPRLARPDDGVAEGHGRPAGVHGGPADRPVGRAGLRVHAEGRRREPAAGRHAGRLRVRDPHRRRPPHDRREGRRQARAARLRAAHRRLGRHPHLEGAGGGPVPGLAAVRRDAARAEQDPAVVRSWAPRGRARAGSRRRAAR